MRIALVGMFALSMLKGCDMSELRKSASPQAVAAKFQESLVPYFPNAKAVAYPAQQIIIGFTCVHGDGPKLVEQVRDSLQTIPELQQLKTLRSWGPILGAPSYHYAAVGFESGIVRLDVDTWEIVSLDPTDGYAGLYQSACGAGNPAVTASDTSQHSAYVFVGHFTVFMSGYGAGRKEIKMSDSLGLYASSQDFESHEIAELNARETMIRTQFAEQNMDVVGIRLDSVDKVPVPNNMLP